jgi:hypothetical protein
MNDIPSIEERVRGFVSAGDDSDWQDVLRRAERTRPGARRVGARTAPRLPLRRRWLIPVGALALLLIAGAAVAAVGGLPWWQSGSPPVDPQAVAAVARDNMPAAVETAHARTVVHDGGAALVAVPLGQTGYCLIPTLGDRGVLGAQCEYQVRNPGSGDDDRLESYAEPASRPGGPAWVVYGRITDPDAAVLDLTQAAGAHFTIALQPGGFFLAEIPTDRWTALANGAGPGRILDASGKTLRTGCVNWGPSPMSKDAGSDVALWSDSDGGSDCKPEPQLPTLQTADLAQAHKLVQLMLTSSYGIYKQGAPLALWEAPGANGSDCVFEARADEAPTPLGGDNPAGGGGCSPSSAWSTPAGHPITVTLGASRLPDGSYAGLIQGHVDPASGISRLELSSAKTNMPVTFANGWFLAQLPNSSDVHLPSGGPWLLTGYNNAGDEVAQLNLNDLQKQAEPH